MLDRVAATICLLLIAGCAKHAGRHANRVGASGAELEDEAMRRLLAEAAALTQRERESAKLYTLWGERARAVVAERGSALVVDVSTMLAGEGTVYWRSGRECVPLEHSEQRTGGAVLGQIGMRPPGVGTAMFRSLESAAGRGGIEVVIGHDGTGHWALDPRRACYLLLLPTSASASVIEFDVVESNAATCRRYAPFVRQWFRSADACRASDEIAHSSSSW